MEPRLVVLDMVGTTVASGTEVPDAFRQAFLGVGVALGDDDVERVRGRNKEEAIADLVAVRVAPGAGGREVAEAVYRDFVEILRSRYQTDAKAIPGAAEAIARLRSLGMAVVLTTGLDRSTTRGLLHGLRWDDLGLDGVVTGDDVARGRPAPDLIHAAMALVGEADASAVVAVGDTVADLEAAFRAGVGWSVGVLSGAHSRERLSLAPHSAILDSVAQLPGWLQGR